MDAQAVRARVADARKHLELAELVATETDAASWKAAGSNAVLAGIAAADAICGHVLGYCSKSPDHGNAIDLLKRATAPDVSPANDLRRLVGEKSLFHYGAERVSEKNTAAMVKYATRLIDQMNRRVGAR